MKVRDSFLHRGAFFKKDENLTDGDVKARLQEAKFKAEAMGQKFDMEEELKKAKHFNEKGE